MNASLLVLIPAVPGAPAVARDLMGGFGMEVDPDLLYPPTRAAVLAAQAERRGYRVRLWDERVEGPAPARDPEGASWCAVLAQLAWPALEGELERVRAVAGPARLVAWGSIVRARPLELGTRLRRATLLLDEEEAAWEQLLALGLTKVDGRDPQPAPGCAEVVGGELTRGAALEPLRDLAVLPAPNRALLSNHRYRLPDDPEPVATTWLTRGCPIDCAFCAYVAMEGRRVRHRPLDQVLEELEDIARRGIRRVVFRDPVFGLHRERTLEFLGRLAAASLPLRWQCETAPRALDEERVRWMAEAGCEHVSLGIETASARLQRSFCGDKLPDPELARQAIAWCRRHGLGTRGFFLLGFPGETRAEMRATARLARSLDPDSVQFCAVTTYPGTALGATRPIEPAAPRDARRAPSGNGVLDAAAIDREIRRAYRAFYARPHRLLGEVLRPARLRRRLRRWRDLAAGNRREAGLGTALRNP